jgi:predicted DNA-binding transcriptional regulator YafY
MKVKNRKRELTAKEYAEQYDISVRTVKRYFLKIVKTMRKKQNKED